MQKSHHRQPEQTRFHHRHASQSVLGRVTGAGLIRNKTFLFEHWKMRVLGSYAIVYLIDGGGRYEDSAGQSRLVVPGDLILVFPDLPHRYGPTKGQRWDEFYLVFDGPLFDLWRQKGLLDDQRPLFNLQPVDHWLGRFESVLGAPRQPGFSPPLLEVCRLQQVLGEALVGGQRGPADAQTASWVDQACALLESDITRQLDLHAVAKRLDLSYESFRKRFTQIVGLPPARYRAARLVDRACELMRRGELTDKQISVRLGFCDEFHFSRAFKRVTGASPRMFRSRLPAS